MSTKHLRAKLQSLEAKKGSDDSKRGQQSSESDEDEQETVENRQANAFLLLASDNDQYEHSDGQLSDKSETSKQTAALSNKINKKAKKKKKNKKKRIDDQQNGVDNFDEILEQYGSKPSDQQTSDCDLTESTTPLFDTTQLLKVDPRKLNPDHEMKLILGAKFKLSSNEGASGQRRSRAKTAARLVVTKRNWPVLKANGLSMSLIQNLPGGKKLFMFEHNNQYREAQHKFWTAADAMNPDAFVAILREHPYHIDTLLQLASVMRTNEDYQAARDLVERALYACECAFHSLFNFTTGECQLDYKQWENRPFFLALFRHILNLCQRSCFKTALEFCKILYALNPGPDPLCVLLLIDFVAIKARRYDFLLSCVGPLEANRNISQLPNFCYSIALGQFLKYSEQDTPDDCILAEADKSLQLALCKFPTLLIPLLDKCNVQPDNDVEACSLFGLAERMRDGKGLQQLISLYVGRTKDIWIQPAVLGWLERNVKEVLPTLNDKDEVVREFAVRRRTHYPNTPKSVLRHLLLSDLGVAMVQPPDSDALGFDYDPVPPVDGRATYTRPQRHLVRGQDGILTAFFRSLMPNYDPEAPPQANNDAGNLQNALRALREMMNGINLNLPEGVQPIDGQEEDDFNAADWEEDFD